MSNYDPSGPGSYGDQPVSEAPPAPRTWGAPSEPNPVQSGLPPQPEPPTQYGQPQYPAMPQGAPVPGVPGMNYAPPTQYVPNAGGDHPQSTTILILGICGLVIFGPLLPFAWYMGNNVHKEILAGAPYRWDGSSAKTGYLIGKWGTIIGGILFALSMIFLVIFFAFFATAASNMPIEPYSTPAL